MGSGYVLDFSDRTMDAFFAEEFSIVVYDKKYDYDFPSKSKANRMRGIWKYEDDVIVGKVILALIDYAETVRLTKNQIIDEQEKSLFQKAKEIGKRLYEVEIIPLYRRSNLYSRIKNTNQLLQERALFQKTLQIVGEIKPHHKYTTPTNEENDDLIQLLIDLDLVQYDWNDITKQTHRNVGNRIIEFSFEADKILALEDRIKGKNGRVKKDALDLIAQDIARRYSLDEIVRVFTDTGVPKTMFTQGTGEWSGVFYVLSYYTTSSDESGDDFSQFIKILEKVLHPLAFDGDESKAKETRFKYNSYLKYDKIQLPDNQFLFEKRHLNRMKEIYIYTAISLHKNGDADYLCENADALLKKYNIGRNDYTIAIERLEKEGIVSDEEKYYEDDHSEFSYDGKKIDHEKLTELVSTYRGWLGYKDEIDLLTVKVLADEIRKVYIEEKLLDAIAGISEGIYTHIDNTLEETLFYYLSAKKKVTHIMNGLEALARMFDIKYHDAEKLLKLQAGFFDTISFFFRELLDEEHYAFWYKKLPPYLKKHTGIKNDTHNSSENVDTEFGSLQLNKGEMTKTVVENGIGFLLVSGGKIEIGPAKNIPFKLVNALCPLGSVKGTNRVYTLSTSARSKLNNEPMSRLEKEAVLQSRLKELQKPLRKKKIDVSLVFDASNETVLLKYISKR